MKVGFTGTQLGMSGMQLEAVRKTLESLERRREWWTIEFHHGDCIGADHEAARVAASMGMQLVVHPPLEPAKRAWFINHGCQVRKAKPYLERNRDIVDETELLIAAPRGEERIRSGSWATVRYARKQDKPIIIIDRYGERA